MNLTAQTADLQKSVDQGIGSLNKMEATAGKVGKMLAGAFTVTAIMSAGKQVLDFADQMTNLSAKTGISTTGLQKLELAFMYSGVSLESVTTASGKLANNLIGGDKGAVAALTKMGLSVAELKRMAPEQQFLTVADAVGKIQNPAEKSFAAMEVFGKGGAALLAGLTGNLIETTDEFERMGLIIDEQTLKAADDFGDKLGLMGRQLLGIVANIVGPLLPALSALGSLLGWLGGLVGQLTGFLVDWIMKGLVAAYAAITRFVAGLADMAQRIPLVGKHLGGLSEASDWLKQQADGADKQLVKMFTSTSNVGQAAATAAPPLMGLGGASESTAASVKKLAAEQEKFLALSDAA